MTDLLFVFSHSPYGSSTAKEGLEAALAAGAFDQDISILFTGDGVWQLLPNQNSIEIGRKSHQKMTQALPMFGIDKIYIDNTSLIERSITANALPDNAKVISHDKTQTLMQSAKHIISF